jgi:homoserine kinase type II
MHDVLEVLRHYPSEYQPARTESLGAAGGMSGAQFWRIVAPAVVRGSPGPAPLVLRGSPDPAPACTLILRRWPTEHPSPERLQFIHSVLDHLAGCGLIFIPVPIRTTTGESFLYHAGHLWELAPWMPGTADYERAPSPEKLRAASIALAQLHTSALDFEIAASRRIAGAPPAISRRLARLQELTPAAQRQLEAAVHDNMWPTLAPLARQFLAALPDAIPRALAQLRPLEKASLPLQPCLRDIWHDHVLFTGNEVTGIVDFGAVDIDTPATDIARLLGSLAGEDAASRQFGLAAYSTVRPLSHDELQAVAALDTSGTLLAGCNWIRWIYIEGRQFENRIPVIERFRKIVARAASISSL